MAEPRPESKKSRAAFGDYAAMGAGRSLDALHKHYVRAASEGRQTPTLKLYTLGEWSRHHNWVARAAAYDADIQQQARQAQVAAIQEMAQRQAALGQELQDKARQGLVLLRLSTVEVIDEQGQKVRVVKVNLTPRDIAALVKTGADLERLARGEATERIDVVTRVRELARELGYSKAEEDEAVAAAERIVSGS